MGSVTKDDRELAAEYVGYPFRYTDPVEYAEKIRQGLQDSDAFVKALASHRIASITEDEIADAISDSLDADWTPGMGARAVMKLLRNKGAVA